MFPPNMFNPFWIRKPVPVLPSLQFPMHHHPPSHHPSFNANFNIMNFRGNNHSMMPAGQMEKVNHKKEFYDTNTIQSIKSELLSNNTTLSASSKVLSVHEPNFGNSYEDEDFNNDNIDVETDSDNEQQMTELKQMNYHSLSDATMKHEEWSRLMKSTMMLKANEGGKNAIDSPSLFPHLDREQPEANEKKVCISRDGDAKIDADPNLEKFVDETRPSLKRAFISDEDDNDYYTDSFTSHELLNLSERKRGKYGNGKGFSIENLIGRMVEDR